MDKTSEDFIKYIKDIYDSRERQLETDKSRLFDGEINTPYFRLQWVAESIYKNSFICTQIKNLVETIEKPTESTINVSGVSRIQSFLAHYSDAISRWSYKNSTCPIANASRNWELDCLRTLHQEINNFHILSSQAK